MAIFRLLHASDLHIAAKPERVGISDIIPKAGLRFPRIRTDGTASWPHRRRLALTSSYSPDILEALIELVYDEGDQLDVVLLSGDLATTGKENDLQKARSCVYGDAQGLWYIGQPYGRPEVTGRLALKGAAKDIVLIPGNHDRFQSTPFPPFFLPGGALFDQHFPWNGRFGWKGEKVQEWVSPRKEGMQLGLVSADLTLRELGDAENGLFGFRGSLGQGKAYADIVDQMKKRTDDLRDEHPGIGLLWVVHFPPQYPKIDDFLRLLEDEALIKAAHERRISHILSGHTHFPCAYTATVSGGSRVEVLCAGTASQVVAPDGNFFHVLEIEVEEEGSTSIAFQTFQWDYKALQWVQVVCPLRD